MTPPREDGALSHPHWIQTLDTLIKHPDTDHNARELAKITKWLINRHHRDHTTAQYLNKTAAELMNRAEQ